MQKGTIEIDFATAGELRDAGILRASQHADEVCEGWTETALAFLQKFAATTPQFMTEDVRVAAAGIVPEPPDTRAWGNVIVKAKKLGYIRKLGIQCKSDKKGHRAFAGVWCDNLIKNNVLTLGEPIC